jgi:hypothetical protein
VKRNKNFTFAVKSEKVHQDFGIKNVPDSGYLKRDISIRIQGVKTTGSGSVILKQL